MARPTVTVFSPDSTADGNVTLPAVFTAPIRADGSYRFFPCVIISIESQISLLYPLHTFIGSCALCSYFNGEECQTSIRCESGGRP